MRSVNVLAAVLLVAAAGWSAGAPAVSPRPSTKKAGGTRAKPDAEIEREIRAKFTK